MSFDAWIVGFGLSTLLKDLGLVQSNLAYLVLVAVGLLDSWLLIVSSRCNCPRSNATRSSLVREFLDLSNQQYAERMKKKKKKKKKRRRRRIVDDRTGTVLFCTEVRRSARR